MDGDGDAVHERLSRVEYSSQSRYSDSNPYT